MSSTSAGLDFEKRVFGVLEAELKNGRLAVRPECCTIVPHKAYYSRDRRANIVFDIAIECRLPEADKASMLLLVECKHYGRPVAVNDVEEFFAKVQQVAPANSKAILASSNSFQRATLEFAASKGIGLLRVFPTSQFKWVLHRSPSSLKVSAALSRDDEVLRGLTEERYHSRRFDFFCAFRDVFTYSLHAFSLALTSEVLNRKSLRAIISEVDNGDVVSFISPDEIEQRCRAIHSAIGYTGGGVPIDAICEWQRARSGLTVVTGAGVSREHVATGILGHISFSPPSITVYGDPDGGVHRQRFTLAHELGHWLLGHGSYMQEERVHAEDLESGDYRDLEQDDIRRLEWQANWFASCLLLPRDSFIASAIEMAQRLDLKDRGYGLLFVDGQQSNTECYYALTSALMETYGVSRMAVKIRLKNLGLLKET